jgi:hypothetical protein
LERTPGALRRGARWTVLYLAVGLISPMLAGCGRGNEEQAGSAPPASAPGPAAPRRGLTGKQKVAILVGAAALYYLYKSHQNQQGAGAQGKYYLSKNGRVYYRDQSGNVHWVTPPSGGVQVPADEAQQYSGYAGYNGSTSGKTFGGYGASNTSAGGAAGGPPGPPGR